MSIAEKILQVKEDFDEVHEAGYNKGYSAGVALTDDADATAGVILSPYTAYVKGKKIKGAIPTKTAADLVVVNGNQVGVPAGCYKGNYTKSVPTATQATPSITVSESGLITATATQSAGYVAKGTKSATKQITLTTTDIYKIRYGASIFGLSGAYGMFINEYVTEAPSRIYMYAPFAYVELSACETVGTQAFYNCQYLMEVRLPACKTIGARAFTGCYELRTVSLGSGLTSIGANAFGKSDPEDSKIDFTFNGTMEQWSAVELADSWNCHFNGTVSITQVKCSDGTVSLV